MEKFDTESGIYSLVQYGNSCFAEGDFEGAIDTLGDALSQQVEKFGELDPKCAELYYLYGRALAESYRQNNGIFSENNIRRREQAGAKTASPQTKTHTASPHLADANNACDKTVSPKPTDPRDQSGDNPCGSPSGSDGSDLEEGSDLKCAWENLDAARIIFEKDLNPSNYASYEEVLTYLAIVLFESGLEEEAVTEFKKAVEFMSKDPNVSPKQFSITLFEFGLVEGFRTNYKEAIELFTQSRDLLTSHTVELKKNYGENKDMIDQATELITQLDDKIQDCNDCIKDEIEKKKLIEAKKEKEMKIEENVKSDDISHLVKRKAKEPQNDGNIKKKVA